ncbi:non-hydrolyzing UDP-N-acetylglucosamine 2-epimerase [Gryllotalpicola protaetiae]|uniref:UDP-N-acetylglucosamine 2-epimerase (non-hydrolyzing) n=1 Tax=Gryllotalpicola protaetiae TaxID=2419771 RepID=A0A387BSX9_9MICO|nr:UDP-N-acetylglucosamine 2-epimerase (non-hydrolyzing) [Gryllotalpicola protaetiae]AYG04169.1 UDP-N-acetylglucosamine 2-epimerase (non-hydrolyzing) [Gryllotalpicola protaetiae]
MLPALDHTAARHLDTEFENAARWGALGPVVLFIVGTRPEAIKMLPVITAFRERRRSRVVVVSTGQHAGLVREVLALGGIRPDVEFPELATGRTLNAMFAHVTKCMDDYLRTTFPSEPGHPDFPVAALVHGDTTSAAAAALACFQSHIPIGHVEAGLRTGDTLSPFPEELNRQLIARIATAHFAPTAVNFENLVREGVPMSRIFVTGNTAIDALLSVAALRTPYSDPRLEELDATATGPIVVVTAHRRESWGDGLRSIATGVRELAELYPHARIVVPLHPNPSVRATLSEILAGIPNVLLTEPLEYAQFARLLGRATVVVTDSGGIQEEAPALGVPVIVTRETTERTEGIDAGTLELVGTDAARIVAAVRRLLDDADEYRYRSTRANPYGDGHAAERIALASEHIVFGTELPQPFQLTLDRGRVLRSVGRADGTRHAA